jgi:hypothetical protein
MKRTDSERMYKCPELGIEPNEAETKSRFGGWFTGGIVRREIYIPRSAARITALILLSTVLQGCAISQLTKGLGSSWFGSSGKEPPSPWSASVSEDRLLAAAKSDAGGSAADMPTTAAGCPKFAIWSQDRNLTVYEQGKSGDGSSIRYRGEITKTARECEIAPGRITVKYGFAGRVLMGPRGEDGVVNLPLLVHVTSKDRLPFTSEPVKVSVAISQDKPIGYFSFVRRVTFDIKPGTRPDDYRLYVAFDRRSES